MLTLRELQQQFIASLNKTSQGDFLNAIALHPRLSPSKQLALYHESIIARFQKTLSDIYPVCYKLVGADFFRGMALLYIQNTSSQSFDLNTYGHFFPDSITHFPPANALSYLPDVARLEWAWHYLLGAPCNSEFDF
jgi:hypothetical protein